MRKRSFKLLLAALFFSLPLSFAQNTKPTPPPASSQPPPAQAPPQSSTPASPQTGPPPPAPPTPPPPRAHPQRERPPQASPPPSHRRKIEPVEKEHIIPPAEAKELFRSVDEIL